MELHKMKELNKKVLEKAYSRVQKSTDMDSYDKESFEAMSLALDNIKDIMKIEKYSEDYSEKENRAIPAMARIDPKTETTEFEGLIYEIAEKYPSKDGMLAITTILAETMEDLRLLHPRIYNLTMTRLKEVVK